MLIQQDSLAEQKAQLGVTPMRICTLSGQSIKLHKRPLRSVQWLLIAFALCSFMGMAFAGGCQSTGDGTGPKCASDDAWWASVIEGFEKAMARCPSGPR